MAGFLYYLPGNDAPTPDRLRAVGFDHADSAALPGCKCTKGPDGDIGWVFNLGSPKHPDGRSPAAHYVDAKQTWAECADGKWWLGWETENPPTPEDLQHAHLHRSIPVDLGEAGTWQIPVLGHAVNNTSLPTIFTPDQSGRFVASEVCSAFRHLWTLVQKLYTSAQLQQWDNFDAGECAMVCCLALAMNYRIGKWEAGVLRLLTSESMPTIFQAVAADPYAPTEGA